MRFITRILACGATLAVASLVAHAQINPSENPIQYVSNQEFEQLLQSGQLQLNGPLQLEEEFFRQLFTDLDNRFVIDTYLYDHPDLRDLRHSIDAEPNNPNVFRTPGGDYRDVFVDNAGNTRTLEFMGQSQKLSMLAGSIRAVTSQPRQLGLYTLLFNQYGQFYNQACAPTTNLPPNVTSNAATGGNPGCANLPQPASLTDPATLTNASLETVQGAIATLGTNAVNILGILHYPFPILPCNLGGSSVADEIYFGDETGGGCPASAGGVLKNFNWLNKNLLTPVKNQGARGTCHIFAATSAMEELIARDTSCQVNLSEEDFMENEKLLWGPSLYGDGGDPETDLNNAQSHKYTFAWEYEWDYNPSLDQPYPPAYEYVDSCDNYPYPLLEPGCSDSAPQAPEVCTSHPGLGLYCGFVPASVPGPRSPYKSDGVNDVWNPANPDLSFDYIILGLAFNDAVMLGFNVSHDFEYDAPGGYVTYDPADIADTADYPGSHVVHVVGYISNADLAANANTAGATPGAGGGYLIIKNSWGACAGDAGYYYMPITYFEQTAWGVYLMSSES